jgi:hypothetical protein
MVVENQYGYVVLVSKLIHRSLTSFPSCIMADGMGLGVRLISSASHTTRRLMTRRTENPAMHRAYVDIIEAVAASW